MPPAVDCSPDLSLYRSRPLPSGAENCAIILSAPRWSWQWPWRSMAPSIRRTAYLLDFAAGESGAAATAERPPENAGGQGERGARLVFIFICRWVSRNFRFLFRPVYSRRRVSLFGNFWSQLRFAGADGHFLEPVGFSFVTNFLGTLPFVRAANLLGTVELGNFKLG